MKFNFLLFAFSFFYVQSSFNQNILTLEQAIEIGLQNNYTIQIADNNNKINQLRNNLGATSMSPQLSLNANYNTSFINSKQNFATGTSQNINNANTQNANTSLNLTWTIFNGFRRIAVKKRLTENENLTSLQLKEQIENIIYTIMIHYYDIIKMNDLIRLCNQNLSLFEERKKIAKLKFEIGTGSKADYLQAELDANKMSSLILQYNLELRVAKSKLNNVLLKPVYENFSVIDSIINNYNPNLNELKKSIIEQNVKINISKQNEKIAFIEMQESKANLFPSLQFNSAYNLSNTNSQVGLVQLDQRNGFNIGLSFSWFLFNGQQNKKLIQEKKLSFNNQQKNTQQLIHEIDATVYAFFQNHQMSKQMINLELQNLQNAKELVEVSLEKYKSGKGTLLETIENYRNLVEIQNRYMNAVYNTKIAEIELMKWNGDLVK